MAKSFVGLWCLIFWFRLLIGFFKGYFIFIHAFPVCTRRFIIKVRMEQEFLSHFFVVPRWVVFGKVISQI